MLKRKGILGCLRKNRILKELEDMRSFDTGILNSMPSLAAVSTTTGNCIHCMQDSGIGLFNPVDNEDEQTYIVATENCELHTFRGDNRLEIRCCDVTKRISGCIGRASHVTHRERYHSPLWQSTTNCLPAASNSWLDKWENLMAGPWATATPSRPGRLTLCATALSASVCWSCTWSSQPGGYGRRTPYMVSWVGYLPTLCVQMVCIGEMCVTREKLYHRSWTWWGLICWTTLIWNAELARRNTGTTTVLFLAWAVKTLDRGPLRMIGSLLRRYLRSDVWGQGPLQKMRLRRQRPPWRGRSPSVMIPSLHQTMRRGLSSIWRVLESPGQKPFRVQSVEEDG